MADLTRYQKKRYLEKKGYQFVSGWVPKEVAPDIQDTINSHEAAVDDALHDKAEGVIEKDWELRSTAKA